MTIPEAIITRFLNIYCPSRVGTKGIFLKVTSGNSISGVSVPSICRKSSNRVSRKKNPERSPNPIKVSQVASTYRAKRPFINPKDNFSIVTEAIFSAELTSGKNFSTPYHINIIPTLSLRIKIPFSAIQFVILKSMLSKWLFFDFIAVIIDLHI